MIQTFTEDAMDKMAGWSLNKATTEALESATFDMTSGLFEAVLPQGESESLLKSLQLARRTGL